MRRIGDILQDLGFKKDAPKGAQEAFLKHLFKNANATSAQNISTNSELPRQGEQLSFDPDVLGVQPQEAAVRKR